MGIGDWFKRTFGKQPCAFCGTEVGMLKRTKIKNKEFICNDCGYKCSRHIEKYRHTKEELLEHMEYMQRQERLYASLGDPSEIVPGSGSRQAIEFFDQAGMFRIRDLDTDNRYPKELFRYDQVASYEPYCDETQPQEAGKPKVFNECGVKITLVSGQLSMEQEQKGMRIHPYILRELKVVVNKRDKRIGMLDVDHIIIHFNNVFGVNDDSNGLFGFGPTKQQRREGEALKAMGNMFVAAVKTAKAGGELSEETKEQFEDAMHKADDANTHGLAKYSRLADEAEAKIQ